MNQLTIFDPKPKRSYHNTLPIQGKELVKRNRDANAQEAFILTVFQSNPERTFTAWECYLYVQSLGRTMIKDSVKRSMTNLLNAGHIVKTLETRDGEFENIKNRAYKLLR